MSQEYLEARRQQILTAARTRFLEDGFHATSMQDILTEAGLSAGALYRYFRSKEEIVAAIALEAIEEVAASFDVLAHGAELPPLADAIELVLGRLERYDEERRLGRIALQVWGEAVRSPELSAVFAEVIGRVRGVLLGFVARYQERGEIDPETPTDEVVRVFTALAPGFLLQRTLLGDVDAAGFAAGLRALIAGVHGGPRSDVD